MTLVAKGDHPLAAYLEVAGLELGVFAKKVAIDEDLLIALLAGSASPTLPEARRISAATGGHVPIAALLSKDVIDFPLRTLPEQDRRQLVSTLKNELAGVLAISNDQADVLSHAAADAILHTAAILCAAEKVEPPTALLRALRLVLAEILAEFPDHDLPASDQLADLIQSSLSSR